MAKREKSNKLKIQNQKPKTPARNPPSQKLFLNIIIGI